MRPSRVFVVAAAALVLGTAASTLPVQVASAQTPSSQVVVPSSGATVSGTQVVLDATASAGVTNVQFELTGGALSDSVIATATPTSYGWIALWNSTTVTDGTYTLQSIATSGGSIGTSPGISITVTEPPTTSMLIPSSGATLSGTTYLDASASNATSVEFRLFGGSYGYNAPVLCTATPTIYGWLCPWDTTMVPNSSYELVAEASNSSESAFSAGVRVTVSNFQVTNYSAPGIDNPAHITAGSDGALWFTNSGTFDQTTKTFIGSSIGRITTAGVVTTYTDPGIDGPVGITAGPDGALWFTNDGYQDGTTIVGASIGRITTAGVVTDYPLSGISPDGGITTGPDGALWFTNGDILTGGPAIPGSIGRITTAGVVTNYTAPSMEDPSSITAGPDGALWFVDSLADSIGRITTAGAVTNDTSVTGPGEITAGPDHARGSLAIPTKETTPSGGSLRRES